MNQRCNIVLSVDKKVNKNRRVARQIKKNKPFYQNMKRGSRTSIFIKNQELSGLLGK